MVEKSSLKSGAELVKQQVITQEDLEKAQQREEQSGAPWHRQLLQMKKVNFDAVNDLLHYEFHSKQSRRSHKNLGKLLLRNQAFRPEGKAILVSGELVRHGSSPLTHAMGVKSQNEPAQRWPRYAK